MKSWLTLILLRASWLCALPLLVLIFPQALYVKKKTIRLAEAGGSNQGVLAGSGPNLRILHAGESTVAGVGVEKIESGLTVQIAQELNKSSQREIQWQIHGVNGIKLKELLESLKNNPPERCDIALISMGVNDTSKLTSLGNWNKCVTQAIHLLQPVTRGPIIFTQVPPMMQFPALPAPLKYFLGLRSTILDLALKKACNKHPNVYYVGSEPKVEAHFMAKDGYHPSAQGYSEWAKTIAPEILTFYRNYR
jgi:lysophospholipase L1-like esterase